MTFRLVNRPQVVVYGPYVKCEMDEMSQATTRAMDRLGEWIAQLDPSQRPEGRTPSIYHRVREEDQPVEFILGYLQKSSPEREELALPEDFRRATMPEGNWIQMLVEGPYHELNQAWGQFSEYIEEKGYSIMSHAYETWLSNPESTPAKDCETLLGWKLNDEFALPEDDDTIAHLEEDGEALDPENMSADIFTKRELWATMQAVLRENIQLRNELMGQKRQYDCIIKIFLVGLFVLLVVGFALIFRFELLKDQAIDPIVSLAEDVLEDVAEGVGAPGGEL